MKTFDNILLLGRPAAGKSEFIDCLKMKSDAERAEMFHIGKFEELDDFMWLWEKFLEDDLWEEANHDRVYSFRDGHNYGLNADSGRLFDLMIIRFNKEAHKRCVANPELYKEGTLFIEFSRGGKNGYSHAISMLSEDILRRSVIVYVRVSFDESWRRNIARYEEKLRHSSLAHMAPRKVMETFYKVDDWEQVSGGKDSGYVDVKDIEIPFVTVLNEPEIKEPGPLAERYHPSLKRLMELYATK